MLKRIKNSGILALVLAAGMAVLQPASVQAADWHHRDGYREGGRVERNWNGDRSWGRREYRGGWDRRDYRGWDRGRRGRGYVYYNYAPAYGYGYDYYAYPSYGYSGYGADPYCPR